MKNLIYLFALTLLFSLANFNSSAFSTDKGGTVQVVVTKHGQAVETLELPVKYVKPNGKFWGQAQVTIFDDKNNSIVLSVRTDKDSIDVSKLKNGSYTLLYEMLDFTIQKSITL